MDFNRRGFLKGISLTAFAGAASPRLMAEGTDAEEAQKLAQSKVFAPGEDEARLGTSIDVSVSADSVDTFVLTEQYQWIARNAHRYGFIIRYTAANQKYTGVEERAWHLRYVGKDAAEFMASFNMCLEDYVSAVKADNPTAKQAD